jgi:hypothetical protein
MSDTPTIDPPKLSVPKRPSIGEQLKPLAVTDPIAWWADEARRQGTTIDALFEKISSADAILEAMFS